MEFYRDLSWNGLKERRNFKYWRLYCLPILRLSTFPPGLQRSSQSRIIIKEILSLRSFIFWEIMNALLVFGKGQKQGSFNTSLGANTDEQLKPAVQRFLYNMGLWSISMPKEKGSEFVIFLCIRGKIRTLEWEAVGSVGEVCLRGWTGLRCRRGGREEDTWSQTCWLKR